MDARAGRGRLVAVVGPSGVGKDSLIAALREARPELLWARRAITRPADASEPFEAVDPAEFEARLRRGEFLVHWRAHGLSYGVPAAVLNEIAGGRDVLANLSRGALGEAAARVPRLLVLWMEAPPDILARRLAGRGREDAEEIGRRVTREAVPMPRDLDCVRIDNGGALSHAVARAVEALG